MDYFSFALTGGKAVTISAFDNTYTGVSENTSIPLVGFVLYDGSYNELSNGDGSFPLTYNIQTSGIYYCKILVTSSGGLKSAGVRYGLSIHQDGNIGAINLVSPRGGESFNPGDTVTIRWTKDKTSKVVDVIYSCDNGLRWTGMAQTDRTFCQWIVPYRNHRTDSALVLVIASESGYPTSNSPRSVSGNFTILAKAPDKYEPNDDFSSAYSIGMGDTVVKNAIVIASDPTNEEGPTYMPTLTWGTDNYVNDSLTRDFDYFKVALTAGKLAILSAVASSRPLPTPFYFYPPNPPIFVYNASQEEFTNNIEVGSLSFAVLTTGNYYCMISAYQGAWYKYDLSIKEATILSTQRSLVDSTAFQKIDSAYSMQLIADTTQVNIGLLLKQQVQGMVTTMLLSPDEIAPASETKVNVKVVSISADLAVSSSIKTAEIILPYNKANLNGYPEHSLKMLRMNDSMSGWTPLDCTVDTVKHQIIANTTRFSIYGVFVPSNTAIGPVSPKLAPTFGIKANLLPQKNSIAVHFSLPKTINAALRLYDIQGRCVRKSVFSAGLMNSTFLWNFGALANGNYFLNIKAGAYTTKEAILIMN